MMCVGADILLFVIWCQLRSVIGYLAVALYRQEPFFVKAGVSPRKGKQFSTSEAGMLKE